MSIFGLCVAVFFTVWLLIVIIQQIGKTQTRNKEGRAVSASSAIGSIVTQSSTVEEMLYYINIPQEDFKTNEFGEIVRNMDNEVYGPFTLSELKNDYPILEDTLITTDALNGEWYEAKCFECFDEMFDTQPGFRINQPGFRINEFGEVIWLNK